MNLSRSENEAKRKRGIANTRRMKKDGGAGTAFSRTPVGAAI